MYNGCTRVQMYDGTTLACVQCTLYTGKNVIRNNWIYLKQYLFSMLKNPFQILFTILNLVKIFNFRWVSVLWEPCSIISSSLH